MTYTYDERTEVLRAINSIIRKCEKVQEKFSEGNAHHTLLRNRLKAMYLSKTLIEERLLLAKTAPTIAAFPLGLAQTHLETAFPADL